MSHPPFACPVTGVVLDNGLELEPGFGYPLLDGVPVLVPDPAHFLALHGPRWRSDVPWSGHLPEPLVVDAPDALTPHLDPGQLAKVAQEDGAPGPLIDLMRTLGARDPNRVCASWGDELAPDGPALDLGGGVGPMAALMALQGRAATLVDRSPRAVLLARDVLTGQHSEIWLPDERGGTRAVPNSAPQLTEEQFRVCIADAGFLPFAPEAFAWVHLGNLVDMHVGDLASLFAAAVEVVEPGGLVTVCTPHDLDRAPLALRLDPGDALRAVLDDCGLTLIEEDDLVTWVVREYRRGYRLLLTDCLALRRPLHAQPR